MPAQDTKQRTGRYNRQTALSQSRRNQNTVRSTSPYGRSGSYQSRTSVYDNASYVRVNTDYTYRGYSNTGYTGRSVYQPTQQASSPRDGYYRNEYSTVGTMPRYSSGTYYGNTASAAYSRPRFTATDELSGMRRSGASVADRPRMTQTAERTRRVQNAARTVQTPVVAEAETLIRRMSREDRIIAGKRAKARVYHIIGVAIIFLMCVFMIYRQTAIFGMNQEIDKLKSEYNGILVTNEGIQASIDKAVELGNLESMAKNELGMVDPDSSQVFYIDMGNRDEVVKSGK